MRCSACGVEAVEQAVYCHKCGARLTPAGDELARDFPPAEPPASQPADAFSQAARRNGPDQPEERTLAGRILLEGHDGGVGHLWAGKCRSSDRRHLLVLWTPLCWLIVLVLMVLPWLYYFAVLCYRRLSVRYLLTTQRFIHERGILRRVNDRVEVLDMDDITFEQGLLERLMGVGTIRIASHDRTDPELVLRGIENVKEVTRLFDNARLAERRRRGLHVEQI